MELPPGTVVVTATMPITPDHREAYLADLREHRRRSLAKPGVLAFQVGEDQERPGVFVYFEIYDEPATLERHGEDPEALAHFERLARWLSGPAEIHIHTTAGSEQLPFAPAS